MVAEGTIAKEPSREPGLNQETLYALGLDHVRRLASRIWNDYNVHDPGITTLELLCYALTDLSHRASFPIADLLASASDNAAAMKRQFFTARQILPNRPLTALDYRKLLIDLAGVKNAWIEEAAVTYHADTVKGVLVKEKPAGEKMHEVKVRGLYDVIVEYGEGLSKTRKAEVLASVKRRLQANRSLCEDFVAFTEIASQKFLLCAEIELDPKAEVARVEAEIYFRVQQYLSPSVVNYTLAEMLERKKADGGRFEADEIFNGPALDCGFIDDDELAAADLRTEIRLSDVISIVMDIEGVRAVRDVVVNPEGTSVGLADKWVVPIAARKKALLNRSKSRLVFYKRNMPVTSDSGQASAHGAALEEQARAKAETAFGYDFEIPLGKHRDVGDYYSFQNHFPALYGLSEYGLNGPADEKRKALSFQLKGYLLFFDQIMANYCAQLKYVKELWSTDPNLQKTYFTRLVESFTDYERIYAGNPRSALEQAAEDEATFTDRRTRFLDHLIARFAERFTEFANTMYSAFGFDPETLIDFKCDFLKNYAAISSERSLAYDYSLKQDPALWNSENVSGLEKRLAKLLGIRNVARRNLGEIAYDIYAEVDATPGDEFRWRIRNRDTGDIILSSSTKYATRELARQEMQTAISFALLPSGYDRKIAAGGKHYFNIVDGGGEIIARRIEYFETAQEMEQAAAEVMEHLAANYSDEGMYLIEMILLRPDDEGDPFLPICPDPNCGDCADADPYSYRIHVILPAFASRFRNMNFRRFVEEVIREETPAHILPRICWVCKEDMAVLEKAYRDWIHLRAGARTAQRKTKLQAFIEVLFAVRNVYPPQKLHECSSGEDQPKFLLNQTALGTMKEEP